MAFQIVAAVARKAYLFETPTQALIFQCLATYCNKAGLAWPSYETLARQCNCSYRTVQRAFEFFKRKRYILVMRRWNTSSVIQITGWLLAELTKPVLSAASWLRQRLGIRPRQQPAQHPSSQPAPSQGVPEPTRARLAQLRAQLLAQIAAQEAFRRSRAPND
jgi:hypothetical protein